MKGQRVVLAIGAMLGLIMMSFAAFTQTASAVSAPNPPAGPTMASKLWNVKDNDAAVIDMPSLTWTWVDCGFTTAPLAPVNYTPCSAGQTPVYADYWTFKAAVTNGLRGTVLFDPETWVYTPTYEQEHQQRYLEEAAELADRHGMTIIETPYASTSGDNAARTNARMSVAQYANATPLMISEDVAAARYSSVVSIQSQFAMEHPAQFNSFVREAVNDMRKVNHKVTILAGIGSQAGGMPGDTNKILSSYHDVYHVVQGYWFNADTWKGGKGCSSEGCPTVARQFFKAIGQLNII